MSLSTPVAFIIFNRPDLTEMVFKAIAQVKPKKLLIIADGPRFPEEAEKCQKTRSIINKVNWDCEVLTNYSEKNLTSPIRCSSGIDWVFSQVEEAIILEDDCVPTRSFFYFCQTLLEYYRNDKRIMHISGNNFQNSNNTTPYSYYFSKYPHVWGWASWRRAWTKFDFQMKTWPKFKEERMMEFICEDLYERKYWTSIFDKCVFHSDPHWDYAWTYASWRQNGLSILPNSNLVSNIGFRSDATRTKLKESPLSKLPTTDIWEIEHPPFIVRHKEADSYTFDYVFGGIGMKQADTLYYKTRSRLSAIKKRMQLNFI
jgi:hypothetical protein